jgi:hypothetical protein
MLVMPAEVEWIIKRYAADLTSRSLQVAEGHACRARRSGIDGQTLFRGPDERVPPRNTFGGARLSCPMNLDGSSNVAQRT